MANEQRIKKIIRQILSNDVGIKGLRIVEAVYQGTDVSELEWSRNKFFRFRNMASGNTFHIRESKLTDLCFRFNTNFVWAASYASEGYLIANEAMAIYRVGQKVFCFKYTDKEPIRIDNMHEKMAWNITRGYHYDEEELKQEFQARKEFSKKFRIPSKPKNKTIGK